MKDFEDMNIELSVIAPCFNEEANIASLVARTLATFNTLGINAELVLVDDGSTDDTWPRIEKASREDARIRGVRHSANQGMEAAWRTGLDAARGRLTCLIDADLQYLPEDIARLYHQYTRHTSDVVQGWRTSIDRDRDVRYICSIGLNVLLNILFGMKAKDNKSGFILTRREVLADILHHRFSYRFYQTFITIVAQSRGYSISQIEVFFDRRRGGVSFLKALPFRVIALALSDIIKGIFDQAEPWSFLRRLYFYLYLMGMPLHHWMITRRAGRYFWALRKMQWLAPTELQRFQDLRLRALVEHAYRNVSYWRQLFDRAGLTPGDIQTTADLNKLPLLEKQIIRERIYFDLLAENQSRASMLKVNTSGSPENPSLAMRIEHS